MASAMPRPCRSLCWRRSHPAAPSVVIGNATVPSVTALASQLAQITLNTTGLAPGLYTITLEIDPGQTIIQGSDAANVVTTSEILLVPNSDVTNGTTSIDGI